MLLEAVNPPQPVRKRRRTGNTISRRNFQFNLTEAEYSLPSIHSNLKFAREQGKASEHGGGAWATPQVGYGFRSRLADSALFDTGKTALPADWAGDCLAGFTLCGVC